MRRRFNVPFLILNIVVTLVVVLIVVSIVGPGGGGSQPAQQIVITVPILVTATTDLNATPAVIIITATPRPGEVVLPDGVIDATSVAQGGNLQPTSIAPAATVNPQVAAGNPALEATVAALPPNCILHTVESGDTPFGIALEFGADGFALMEVNGLDDAAASNLQIGQVLIVPLPGCALIDQLRAPTQTQAAAQALTPTNPPTSTGTPPTPLPPTDVPTGIPTETLPPTNTPTATLPPTAANAQVMIVNVIGVGDVTSERIEIRNNGPVVNLLGWTLRDSNGNIYTFPERRLFQNAQVTLFSGVGQDTSIALFWGRTQAVLQSGEALALIDAEGRTQSIFVVP